jgi:hypothetical protein
MPNDERKEALAGYIKKYMKKGYSADVLKSYLAKKGYSEPMIDSSMRIAKKPVPIKMPKIRKELIVVAGVGFVVILAFLIISVIPFTEGCGFDRQCFLDKANNCEASILKEDLQGSIVRYESSTDCKLTKRFERFSDTEPEEIEILFKQKDMTCTYSQGNLDPDLVSLVGGIEFCEGNLKDSIYELRLAQIALS